MKLKVRIYKHITGDSEIRIAQPPFDTSNTVAFCVEGAILVSLHSQGVIDVIREELELDDDDWFDSIEWKTSFHDLVDDFVDAYRSGGRLELGADERANFESLAKALDDAAALVRSALSDAEDKPQE